jgi:hypothetical protein
MTPTEAAACEEIRRTLAQYNQAGDADDARAFADSFAADGELHAVAFEAVGRENIHAWKAEQNIFAGQRSSAPVFRMHNVTSTLIEFRADGSASVRSYFFVVTNTGPDHAGRYFDVFVENDGRWLIKNRRAEVLWRAETSLIGPEQVLAEYR